MIHARRRFTRSRSGQQTRAPDSSHIARAPCIGRKGHVDIETVSVPEEGHPDSGPGYQELLYEATRFEPAEGITVEVASPEDIEHYSHRSRTGRAPQMRITRAAPIHHDVS